MSGPAVLGQGATPPWAEPAPWDAGPSENRGPDALGIDLPGPPSPAPLGAALALVGVAIGVYGVRRLRKDQR